MIFYETVDLCKAITDVADADSHLLAQRPDHLPCCNLVGQLLHTKYCKSKRSSNIVTCYLKMSKTFFDKVEAASMKTGFRSCTGFSIVFVTVHNKGSDTIPLLEQTFLTQHILQILPLLMAMLSDN